MAAGVAQRRGDGQPSGRLPRLLAGEGQGAGGGGALQCAAAAEKGRAVILGQLGLHQRRGRAVLPERSLFPAGGQQKQFDGAVPRLLPVEGGQAAPGIACDDPAHGVSSLR